MERLDEPALVAAARLLGPGSRSGAVVVGLSSVRRTRDLALVFIAESVSQNTRTELGRLETRGARLFLVERLEPLAGPLGRGDAQILAVKAGPLARGIAERLATLEAG